MKILKRKKENRKKRGNLIKEEGTERRKTGFIYSINSRLILAFMIPILFIVILGVITYTRAAGVIINNYKTAAGQTVAANGNYFNLIFNSVEAKSTQIVSNTNIGKYYAGGYEKNSVDEYNAYNGAYQDLLATIGSDKFLYSINLLSNENNPISTFANFEDDAYRSFPESEEAFKLEESGKQMIWDGYHEFLDKTLGLSPDKYASSLTRYFKNKAGKAIGYVILDIKMESIVSVLDNMDMGEGSDVAFVTAGQRRITRSGIKEESLRTINNEEAYLSALDGEKEYGAADMRLEGEKYLFLYSRIGKTGALLYSLIPERIILKQVSGIKTITILLIVAAVIIAIIICALISAGISRTVRHIVKRVDRAAGGDLTAAFTLKRKDEFGILISSISEMMAGMRHLIQKTADVADVVQNSASVVEDTAGKFVKSQGQIAVSLNEIEKGALQQSGDAENCLGKMDDLSKRIGRVCEKSGQIEQAAADTKIIAGKGMQMIGTLEEKVGNTFDIIKLILDETKYLKEASDSIDDIIIVINDVADQTNLLSLNASIEAARAGQAGRGFAVVAEEIRKLAEQSLKAAEQVRERIVSIHEKTDKITETAQNADSIVMLQEQALNDTVTIFKRIDGQVDNLAGFSSVILEQITNMDSAKVSTLGSVESISSVIEESAAVTSEVNETARRQLEDAEKLKAATKQLNRQAIELKEAVKAFIIQ